MAEIGAFGYTPIGGDYCNLICRSIEAYGGTYNYAMESINEAICFRFTATTTKDIKAVKLYWNSSVSPGTVRITVETIDTATGKPTGSLYDSNATVDVTPSNAAWQTCTFATLPTTGLTVGNEYGIVIITTVAGSAHTIKYQGGVDALPLITLIASDGTTRSNFAEQSTTIPVCTLIMDDDTQESLGMCPYAVCNAPFGIYGNDRWCGSKISIPSGLQFKIRGIAVGYMASVGTPSSMGDLRCRILNSVNSEVFSRTIDKDSIIGSSTKRYTIATDVITLSNGTYRIVFDSSGSNSSNYRYFRPAKASDSVFVPTYNCWTYCTDGSTGPTWTDDSTSMSTVQLLLDDIVATAAATESFTGTLINRGIN